MLYTTWILNTVIDRGFEDRRLQCACRLTDPWLYQPDSSARKIIVGNRKDSFHNVLARNTHKNCATPTKIGFNERETCWHCVRLLKRQLHIQQRHTSTDRHFMKKPYHCGVPQFAILHDCGAPFFQKQAPNGTETLMPVLTAKSVTIYTYRWHYGPIGCFLGI